MLVGKKVTLRAYDDSLDDGEMVVEWRNDPQVKAHFFEEEPLSLDLHWKWIDKAKLNPNIRYYMIQINEDDDYKALTVGTIGLNHIDWRNRTAEFSWFLIGEPKRRNWGYGKEAIFLLLHYAFNHLNLNRIWLQTMTLNKAASIVYRKMGFRGEGILRGHKFKNGEYIDIYIYGLLRKDFDALMETLLEELEL